MTGQVIHTIEISGGVEPEVLYARPGQEIRWHNSRKNPVRLGFLTMKLLDEVGCEKGVLTLFGQVNDLVMIPPGESVSLCFVRRGEMKYNVWLDPENPRGAITPTASIRVEGGG